jgi:hypothetical protein
LVTGPLDARAGDENRVPASSHPGLADSLSQPAFNLVPNHGISNSLARNEPETASVKPVGEEADNQVTIRRAAAVPVDLGEPFAASQA